MTKTTEARGERVQTPLTIDQSLDARDAFAKALYHTLFSWLVARINQIVYKGTKRTAAISILDIFGFEDFQVRQITFRSFRAPDSALRLRVSYFVSVFFCNRRRTVSNSCALTTPTRIFNSTSTSTFSSWSRWSTRRRRYTGRPSPTRTTCPSST